MAAVEELQRIEGDVATLTAHVALFSECLAAAGEEPAEVLANEVLVDMLPSLRESQPRVLRLIEGGEVEDEGEAAAVAIFVILAVVGVVGLIFWLYRSNKLRECCPSEEVEASAGELELDKVSSSAKTTEPQTEMV